MLTRRRLVGMLAAAPLAVARRASAQAVLDGDALFAKAKSTFRSHRRPEFVVYTLSRREEINGEPLLEETYRMRIWYRSADRAAMARLVPAKAAPGPLQYLHVAFNQATDPGPPTTDIFEAVPPHGGLLPTPQPAGDLRTIQSVSVSGELDYRVAAAQLDGSEYHLWVTPRRDPDRNRLRELWIDAQTFEVRRVIATDRLYHAEMPESWDRDQFDMTLELQDDVPVIRHIFSTTEVDADTRMYGPHVHDTYDFTDIAFPETLPSWYFHPDQYGLHIAEAPRY